MNMAKGLRPVRSQIRFASVRAITALILREMTTTYGRSPGGYVWMVIEPVLGIALLAAVFSLGFRNPPIGSNFAIFYATGLLPFFMFIDVSTKLAQAINYSRQLLAYPRVTFVDAIVARLILSVLTRLLVSCIVFAGILVLFDTRTTLELARILLSFAMAIALGAGVGTLNCFAMSMFPVWQQVWSIVTRPLILVSGVIFLFDAVPEPWRGYLWFNPLVHVTGEMRAAFYVSYDAPYVAPAYVFAVSLIAGLIGLVFLHRYHRDIMEL